MKPLSPMERRSFLKARNKILMQTALNRQEDGTIELTITIPWQRVKENFDKLFKKALSEIEIEGFRKGKAPQKLAEKKVNRGKVYEEVVKEIIPRFYLQAVKEHSLQPIISPEIKLIKAKESKDWQFKVFLCEKPEVELGDYKKAIGELKSKKRTKIWVPGRGKEKEEKKEPSLDEIIEALLKAVKIKLPQILLEDHVNRGLASLLDQTQKLGLTIDQYLKAKGKTAAQLREEQRKQAERTLTLEFVLEKVADEEKITVSEEEIDQLINKERDKKIRDQLKNQKYYLASLLRRQKTLDKLLNP